MSDEQDVDDINVMKRPKSKLSQTQLENFLSEMRHEPNWREQADRCQNYYDGEQRTSSVLVTLQERGLPILTRNEIAPAIDILLGMEAKNKTRSKVTSDSKADEAETVARGLTAELIKLERVTRTERACSDAYGSEVKAGLGWVEVAKEDNRFLGDMRVQEVHRKELYWDWRSKRPDLLDCRYLIRRQFLDKDILITTWPKHKDLIEHTLSSWSNWDAWETNINNHYLSQCHDLEHSRTTIHQDEWISTDRKRLCVYETWYRVSESIMVFTDQQDVVREFDKKNMKHAVLVASGIAKLSKSITSKVRIAWWIGPHLISDEPSPYNHNYYPYVPFWGFRDDQHKMPYSLVKRMLSPQDEINARLSKNMDLLSSKRVTMDADAVDLKFNNYAKVRKQVASSNSFVITNPNRKNKDGFKVETDIQLSDRQYELMNSASMALKEISGVVRPSESSNMQSGVAFNASVEQGNIGTAELNDNYRYGKTLVSELLLASIKQRIGEKETPVIIDENIDEPEEIVLNSRTVDENGMNYISNSVIHSRTEVEIEEIPSHQSVKQQQLNDMLDFLKHLPEEYRAASADKLVMSTDLEYKKDLAEVYRNLSGLGDSEKTPEQMEAEDQAKRKEEALIDKDVAAAEKLRSETVNKRVESTYSAVQSAGSLAAVPELIPTADSILKSSGFEDQNNFPVAQVNTVNTVLPEAPVLPDNVEQTISPGNTNTSPMFPDRMNNPAEGMNTGIETPTIEDNNNV